MAYLGNNPTTQSFTSGTDYFSGTGSQTAFTLTRTVNSVNDIEVVINNVVQQPSTAYTLSGTTVTFTSAPSSGTNNIYVRYLATNMQSFTVPANSITRTQLDSNLQAGFQGRNKIINGHMVVDQRNAGASVTPTDGQYTLDRWRCGLSQASKFSVQQNSGSVTPPAGFNNYLGVVSLSAYTPASGDVFMLQQKIEGFNVVDLGYGTSDAKTVTLSFWVRSSLTGSFGGCIYGENYYSYPFSYTISTANTWEQKTVTIVGNTSGTWLKTNGNGLELRINLGSGSSYQGTANVWANANNYSAPTGSVNVVGTSGATFYITGVQLEEGTTATSFEREIYSVTLQKCQRYFHRWDSSLYNYTPFVPITYSYAPSLLAQGTYFLPVTMRSTPTTTSSAYTTFGVSFGVLTITAISAFTGITPNIVSIYFNVNSSTIGYTGIVTANGVTTAYINFSAEL